MSEVDCSSARDALSADLDREALPHEAAAAHAHLGTCRQCQRWQNDVIAVHRSLRIRTIDPVPDLAPSVLSRVPPITSAGRDRVRWMLATVALTELALALPALLAGYGAATVHDARHIGSFGVAISTGLLYVAWRPMRAVGILPIVATLAVTMGVAAAVDMSNGRVSSLGEAHHVLEFAGLLLVWMLAGCPLPTRCRALWPTNPRRRAAVR